jgi:hypothetical protein
MASTIVDINLIAPTLKENHEFTLPELKRDEDVTSVMTLNDTANVASKLKTI